MAGFISVPLGNFEDFKGFSLKVSTRLLSVCVWPLGKEGTDSGRANRGKMSTKHGICDKIRTFLIECVLHDQEEIILVC